MNITKQTSLNQRSQSKKTDLKPDEKNQASWVLVMKFQSSLPRYTSTPLNE
jgi:hypothetical protein